MKKEKMNANVITDAEVQEVREIIANLSGLPLEARQKIQYIIEGAKLVTAAAESAKQGGAA